jgi:hypothetical protein
VFDPSSNFLLYPSLLGIKSELVLLTIWWAGKD